MRRKKLILIAVGTIAVLAILFIILKNGEENQSTVGWPVEGRPVKLVTVEARDGALMREFPGIAKPVNCV